MPKSVQYSITIFLCSKSANIAKISFPAATNTAFLLPDKFISILPRTKMFALSNTVKYCKNSKNFNFRNYHQMRTSSLFACAVLTSFSTQGFVVGGAVHSAKSAVFSAAGKFLQGKTNKSKDTLSSTAIGATSNKSSKTSKLLDLGTNVAMAVAGAGTLYQALSDSAGRSPVQVIEIKI